jgi:hypothetical protein
MSAIADYTAMLEDVVRSPPAYPEARFSGRGIVICAGGDVYFPCAWVAIGMLRALGCTLPIELWYRGPREMTAAMIALLEPFQVVCVDAYDVARRQPYRRLDSWEIKPFAIAYSRFAEVLYVDADNVPLRNPEFLFATPEYKNAGSLFWPDRYSGPQSGIEWLKREAWALCGVSYRLEPEIEAGQLLIDKSRCWPALMLTLHLNEHSDFYYAYFYGDKDTFHLAWRRTGLDYALIRHPPRNLGNSEVIIQHDIDGAPLFQHRNGDKWSLMRPNARIAGFVHEPFCFELLARLRALWSPPVRSFPADFTAGEASVYEELCGRRYFQYALEGYRARVLEFRSDFRIGQGAQTMEARWMIEDDKDGAPLLSIRNDNAPTCFLRRSDDGIWRGRWLVYDRMRVELRPLESR